MKQQDRRGFLKLFGVTTAAIAATPNALNADPKIEIVKASDQASIEIPAPAFPRLRDYLDVRDEPLWSRLRVEQNAMAHAYRLFQEPLGRDTTLADTNMYQHGKLIAPEMFCIKQIGFVFSPKTIPALRSAFIDRYALELFLGHKRYWQAPLATVFSVADPKTEKDFATLPDAGFVTLDIPLVILDDTYFSLEVVGTPIHPCGKLTGWAVFKGLHAVGIQ